MHDPDLVLLYTHTCSHGSKLDSVQLGPGLKTCIPGLTLTNCLACTLGVMHCVIGCMVITAFLSLQMKSHYKRETAACKHPSNKSTSCQPANAVVEARQAQSLHQDAFLMQHIWHWHSTVGDEDVDFMQHWELLQVLDQHWRYAIDALTVVQANTLCLSNLQWGNGASAPGEQVCLVVVTE